MNEPNACIVRVEGTNCDKEMKTVFDYVGANAEVVHTNQFKKGRKSLGDFDILVFPGGFSYGDYVRAGAIWAAELKTVLYNDIKNFHEEGKPIFGVCNGFQVLVELGILPALNGTSSEPEAVLATNNSSRYECRMTHLKRESEPRSLFVKDIDGVLPIPIGHGEGKFVMRPNDLETLENNRQVVFRYVRPDGSFANSEYPYNPNGALNDIAGVCDSTGTVLGMMPHPERAAFKWQMYNWTRELYSKEELAQKGPGMQIIKNIVDYARSF